MAWSFWEPWISEIVTDFWSVSKLGISSTLALIGVVSLPTWFVFRVTPTTLVQCRGYACG
jgi:hypothetical protein